MKTQSFKRLIKREFVRSALIPIIIIEIMLLVLYFSINAYKTHRTRVTLLEEVKENVSEMAFRETRNINAELMAVSQYARILQSENQRFFRNPEKFRLPDVQPVLKVAKNGTMYKANNNGGGSIYYAGITPFSPFEYSKASNSEALDPLFKIVADIDSNIVAVYLNTYDNMNRYYPYIEKTYEQYMPNMEITSFNFYYEADSIHNPSRDVVWTDAYLDPAGMGWMASCIVPVYKGNFLEGVVGIDITIENFKKNILGMKIPWNGKSFLADNQGVVIAMPASVEKILGLAELTRHDYSQLVQKNTYKPDEYNLLKNESIPGKMRELVQKNQTIGEIKIKEKTYIIAQHEIEETGWRFYTLVDESIVLAPVKLLTRQSNILGYLAIAFLILFYIPFFLFLKRRAEKISSKITSPVHLLVEATTEMSKNLDLKHIERAGIEEIDELSDNFNVMTDKLKILYAGQEEKINEGIKLLRDKDHLIIKQSRQAAMGEMIGNIAHQWRQPLNSLGVIVQNIEDAYLYNEINAVYLREKVSHVMNLLNYMSHTIDDFRNFFKPDKEKQNFSIYKAVQSAVGFMEANFIHNNIKVEFNWHQDTEICGYPNEYAQVMLNIL
ncbi:MAG: hypothetical protein CVU06_07925, partial [Bacteroidetes bacterium HGW-Bacteroidetes-22]